MVVEKDKQLKVDNWGSFFLHRLFLLYEKGEKCDGTLLFKDGHTIKVHKLVLMTCTDYFDEHLWTNNTFTLPPVLGHGAVLPIVNFMYTGFLNFNAEIHHAVFTAAKFLNVTILMKLLHAQLDIDPVPQPTTADPVIPSTTIATTSEPSSSSSVSTPSLSASSVPPLPPPPPTLPLSSSSLSSSSPSVSVVSTKSVLRKVKKLPKISKPLFITQQPASSSFPVAAAASSSQTVPGKKLPFWKKRTTAIAGLAVSSSGAPRLPADYYGRTAEAEPLPSRCQLAVGEGLVEGVPGEGELSPRAQCPSYDTFNLASPSFHHQQTTPTEEIVREFYRLNNKRPPPHCMMTAVAVAKEAVSGHRSSDVTDMEIDNDGGFDDTCTEPMSMDETVLLTSAGKRPAIQYGNSAEEKFDRLTRLATPPKPILKPLTSDCVATGGGGSSSKKVRFSLAAEGKENTASANSVTAAVSDTPTTAVATPTTPTKGGAKAAASPVIGCSKEVVTSRVSITGDKSANLNATHIISELMKKNPDLMKNNKNIRVSIVSGGGATATAGGRRGKTEGEKETTKVRYIVMKQQMGGGGGSGAGARKESEGGKNGAKPNAENMTGPWLCEECGVTGHPMQFETYYLYRRHLHEIHQERIDARICEYCGYKSSKRNLHLYHLYTKHGVPPPRNIRFPKCEQCNYIALSDSLLIKHNNNHSSLADKLQCKACVLTFKTPSALQTHLQSCPKSNKEPALPDKEYICQFCQKTFNRSINLKAHMRIAHKNQSSLRSRYEEEGEEEEEGRGLGGGAVNINLDDETTTAAAATSNLLQVIRLPMMDASGGDVVVGGEEEVGEERALLLPAGMFLASGGVEGGAASSSEQEAMSTVSSGIAASLNLADANGHQTVILLDGSSELVFEPGNAVMLQPAPQDGSTVAAGCTEYIVPEVITSASQLFQAHAQTTEAEGQQQEHEVQTLESGLPEGTSIIVVPPDSQLTNDQLTGEETVLTTETHITSDAVGTTGDELAPDENSAAEVEEDKCTNIVEEACKRETIIIETSSVVGAVATTEVSHEQNGGGGDSVIVSGPRMSQQSRIDLASDWDEVESDSRGDGSDCRGDLQRPSRATFDGVEESILPDMI